MEEVRFWILDRLHNMGLSPDTESLAAGLVCGDRSLLSPETLSDMREAGMSHLMAVSGLHIGLLWMILRVLFEPLSTLKFYLRWNDIRWFNIIRMMTLVVVWLYVWMIGFSPSAVRAAFMITLVEFGKTFYVDTWDWDNLIFAALLMLCYDPALMTDVGFQLSFAATAGIFAFRPFYIRHRNRYEKYHEMPFYYKIRYIINLLYVTLAAQAFTLPICAYYFHHIPLLGFVQGVLAVPVVMVFVYGVVILLFVPQALGALMIAEESLYHWLSLPVEALSWWIRQVAHWVTRAELWMVGGRVEFYPTVWEAILLQLIIVGLTIAARERKRRKIKIPR